MEEPDVNASGSHALLQRLWKELVQYPVDFFDLLFPKLCAGCDAHLLGAEKDLCLKCTFGLAKTYYWDYDVNPVEELFRGRLHVTWACAFLHFYKGGHVQKLLHRMKYEGQPQIGSRLGSLFAHQLTAKGRIADVDVIVPIPLHHTRERRRGYNQSLFIALGMAEVLHCKVDGKHLFRKEHTDTQTRKSKYDRATNVESVFAVRDPRYFKGKNVLLVDDVVTTGSTLEAAGRELLDAGARRLYIAALACPD